MARIHFSFLNRPAEEAPAPEKALPPEIPLRRNVLVGNPSRALFESPGINGVPPIQVFFSGKGGSGTSLLAASFAGILKSLTHLRVLLVDMDLQSGGGIEAYTGIESERSIIHLKPVLNELTEAHIRNVVQIDPQTGLAILSCKGDPEQSAVISPTDAVKLLTEVKKHYDVVILDAGNSFTPLAFTLLMEAVQVHYILTPDTPALLKYQQTLTLCRKNGVPIEKIGVILNRAGRMNEIRMKDLKGIQPLRIEGTVQSDFSGIQSSVNLGNPIIRHMFDKRPPKAVKDMVHLTKKLTGQV